MWKGILEGGFESLGEIGKTIATGMVEVKKEEARQPERMNQVEPIKGKNPDGSTTVAAPRVQAPISQNTLLIGGAIGLGLIAVLLIATRK